MNPTEARWKTLPGPLVLSQGTGTFLRRSAEPTWYSKENWCLSRQQMLTYNKATWWNRPNQAFEHCSLPLLWFIRVSLYQCTVDSTNVYTKHFFMTGAQISSATAGVSKVHLVWMNHLDVGFTNNIASVLNIYWHQYFPMAINTANEVNSKEAGVSYFSRAVFVR